MIRSDHYSPKLGLYLTESKKVACHDRNVNRCPLFDLCPHVPCHGCPEYTVSQYYRKFKKQDLKKSLDRIEYKSRCNSLFNDLKKVYYEI